MKTVFHISQNIFAQRIDTTVPYEPGKGPSMVSYSEDGTLFRIFTADHLYTTAYHQRKSKEDERTVMFMLAGLLGQVMTSVILLTALTAGKLSAKVGVFLFVVNAAATICLWKSFDVEKPPAISI